jgi:rfaE bifunctional protein kinase chain/domain
MTTLKHGIDIASRRLLESVIDRFDGVRVLVVGDLILDKYTVGRPTRLSREAPIPVLEYLSEYSVPGGGTSPACTIASLHAKAFLAGVVGDDLAGTEMLGELSHYGVDTNCIVLDPSRPTTAKRRIVARVTPTMLQQVARIDHVERQPISGDVERNLITSIEKLLPACDAVLISNYKSGTLTPAVIDCLRSLSSRLGKLSTVDSQGDLTQFHGFDIIKCNQPEAEEALRRPLNSESDFQDGLAELLASLGARAVIVTRSAEGMSVLDRDTGYCHIPVTNTSEVFDVTGAGDTVIAIVTLGLCAGTNLFDAARLANYGAGIVVRKWGNAILQPDELRAALRE